MLCLYNITVHWTWNCPKCGNDLFSHYLFIWINTLKLDETVDWVNSFRLSDAYMHQYNIPTLLWTDNGMSPVWGQAIIWTNAAILSIRPKGTYFGEILLKIQKFSFKEMHLDMTPAKWWPCYLSLNVLRLMQVMSCHMTATSPRLNQYGLIVN